MGDVRNPPDVAAIRAVAKVWPRWRSLPATEPHRIANSRNRCTRSVDDPEHGALTRLPAVGPDEGVSHIRSNGQHAYRRMPWIKLEPYGSDQGGQAAR